MFVAAGAKERILQRRRSAFYDNYIRKLLREAESIGLDPEQVIRMIRENEAQNKEERDGRTGM